MIKRLLSVRFISVFTAMTFFLAAIAGCAAEPTRSSSGKSIEPETNKEIASLLSGNQFPFQSIVKGYRLGSAMSEPTLIVAYDEATMNDLISQLSAKDQLLVEEVDIEKELIIAVFEGVKPSGGFSLTIENMFVSDDKLTVKLLLQENDPDFPKIEAVTTPYHVVKVDRDTLSDVKSLNYYLISGGERLGTGELH